jgi:hypothetical protein
VSVQANCPACGGPCTFQISSALVAVCPYCRSVIGRTDKGLEDLGKVADLVETGSPLDVWVKGRQGGVPFTLTGRVQYRHPAGGVWDEWYAAFTDGRWGWLAEAQGRFYLTFERPAPADLPTYEQLDLGQKVKVGADGPLIVAEKNRGQTAGAVGEIPYRLVPGAEHPFADLSGPGGAFGTLDYSEGGSPTLYLGREITLDELGIPQKARRKYPGQEPRIQAVQLNCPKCGAALALRAPDKSERVGCPSCGALLDVKEGQLKLLKSLEPPKVQPIIPLGATGKRDGIDWTVIGFQQRSVRLSGEDYPWEEYLLYQPRLGFRWLTRSDDHWNWVTPLPPGTVTTVGSYALYAGKGYRLFQKARAKTDFVLGEFYWKVQAGEKVASRDYVSAPDMLSEEVSRDGSEGEINWSHGVYLFPEEVERMFGLKALPWPGGIGPNQPFPYSGMYRIAGWLTVAALLLAGFLWLISPRHEVLRESTTLKSRQVIPDRRLELKSHENIRIVLSTQGSGWVFLRGELTPSPDPPKPGEPQPKAPPGSQRPFNLLARPGQPAGVYLSAVPGGRYAVQYEADWEPHNEERTIEVRVEQGVSHPMPLLVTLLILGVVPFVLGLYQLYFESRRWQDSTVE